LADARNAGPAAQLALLLGGDDRFARTAQIAVTAAVLVVTVAAARRGGDPVARLAWAAAASLATLPVTWFHYPSALIPFGLAALFRSDGRPFARSVERLIAAALAIAAIAIAFPPLPPAPTSGLIPPDVLSLLRGQLGPRVHRHRRA